MKYILVFVFSYLYIGLGFSQIVYPIVGRYQGKTAQGMAIWEDEAYLFNDEGHCRVLNLKTGKVQREFDLASSGKKEDD